jgi:hypothetical protein
MAPEKASTETKRPQRVNDFERVSGLAIGCRNRGGANLMMDWPGSAGGRLPGRWLHLLKPHVPYGAPAATRNQERLRIAHWTVSR